ncbi:MAG: oligosaccharide flippase family protein [Polaribacter sp.]
MENYNMGVFKEKLKLIITNNKTSITNLVFQYLNNGISYLIPFILIPYLILTLGLEEYGKFAFAFAFASYFKIIVDFGFDISLTKHILNYCKIKNVNSSIFSMMFVAKLTLALFSALIFFTVISVFTINNNSELLIICFLFILSSVFNLNSFFYAFNDVKTITIVNSITKVVYLILVFTFIKSQEDLLLFVIINISSYISFSLILFVIAIKKYKIKFDFSNLRTNRNIFIIKESYNSFISNLAVSFYGTTNTFVLGLFGSPYIVGVFSVTEKVYIAFTSMISSSNFVLYPKLITLFKVKEKFLVSFRKIEFVYFLAVLFSVAILFVSRFSILEYLNLENSEVSINYFNLFIVALIFSPFGAFYTRMFLVLSISKKLVYVTMIGFVVNTSILIILVSYEFYNIFPLCVIITQVYIAMTKRRIVFKEIKKQC